jgi:imidazolonepropionase
MILLKNIGRLVTMEPGAGRVGALGVIENACLRVTGDRVVWFGAAEDLPGATDSRVVDCNAGVVMPGLVECHTHLVYAGSRADEFRMRAEGKTYQEIAKAGGGILSTVKATRIAGEDELLKLAKERADEFLERGVTAMEIKSGYGLDLETEEKILRVAKRLGEEHEVDIVTTFLGAHVVPREYKDRRADYVKLVTHEMLPRIAGQKLAKFCDVFVEEGAFTADEARTIAEAASKHGMRMKLHVDQFSDGGGGELAAELNAVSADHLDYTSERGIEAMAKAGVVGVLLPSATLFAKSGRQPAARSMADGGMRVAVSTDFNPGTSPTTDLMLNATMAVTQMGLKADEALMAVTSTSADALLLNDGAGRIAQGKKADLVSFDVPHEDYLLYRFGTNYARHVIKAGNIHTRG